MAVDFATGLGGRRGDVLSRKSWSVGSGRWGARLTGARHSFGSSCPWSSSSWLRQGKLAKERERAYGAVVSVVVVVDRAGARSIDARRHEYLVILYTVVWRRRKLQFHFCWPSKDLEFCVEIFNLMKFISRLSLYRDLNWRHSARITADNWADPNQST